MKNKTKLDKKLLKEIISSSQSMLYTKVITDRVMGRYVNTALEDRYIILKKDNKTKPMLCVHLDTINTHSRCTDENFNINDIVDFGEGLMLKPTSKLSCLGADDKAGVYIIFKHFEQLIKNFHIGLFCDEEIGGIGSKELTKLTDVSCFIGLDREGNREVATYGYDNSKLITLFTDLGYEEQLGSFTDASVLAGIFNKPCVNLSVGYYNQHTSKEYLLFDNLQNTIDVLLNSVDLIFDKDYPIEMLQRFDYSKYYNTAYNEDIPLECFNCFLPINDGKLENELVWGHCPHCYTEIENLEY